MKMYSSFRIYILLYNKNDFQKFLKMILHFKKLIRHINVMF